ncbi:MAG: O-antigen ligase family protein, partial [Candidatus Sumerlaeia bacterium]|nr:O-antigen ligase family protein [Candidatus Sumerlaeia bacterium]
MNVSQKLTDLGRTAVIFLLIGGTPLFIVPDAYDSFILPKIVFIKLLVIVLALFSIINILFNNQGFKIRLNVINAVLAFFVFLHFTSLIYTSSKSLARDSISFTFYLFVMALLIQDYLLGKRTKIVVLGWVLLVSGVLTAGWVLIQDFIASTRPEMLGIMPKLSDWRGFLSAGLGNTNHIGDFLALSLIVTLMFFLFVHRKWREILVLLSLGLISAGLFVCWSLGSNLGLLVAVIFMAVYLLRFERQQFCHRHWKRLICIAVVALLILVFYLTPHPLNPHRPSLWQEAFASERWRAGGPTRLVIWLNTLEIIRQHSLLGVGAGNFTYAYVQVLSPLILASPSLAPYAGCYTNAAHNELLQTWAELGILGLTSFLFLIAVFCWQLFQDLKYSSRINFLIRVGVLALMIAWVVQAQLNFLLQLPLTRMLFFILLIIPGILLDRTRFRQGSLIPVEFNRGFFSISLWLEQMRIPQVLELKLLNLERTVKIVMMAGALGFCSWLMIFSTRPLLSDILYKSARMCLEAGDLVLAENYFHRALSIWQEHSDCRSAYS